MKTKAKTSSLALVALVTAVSLMPSVGAHDPGRSPAGLSPPCDRLVWGPSLAEFSVGTCNGEDEGTFTCVYVELMPPFVRSPGACFHAHETKENDEGEKEMEDPYLCGGDLYEGRLVLRRSCSAIPVGDVLGRPIPALCSNPVESVCIDLEGGSLPNPFGFLAVSTASGPDGLEYHPSQADEITCYERVTVQGGVTQTIDYEVCTWGSSRYSEGPSWRCAGLIDHRRHGHWMGYGVCTVRYYDESGSHDCVVFAGITLSGYCLLE